MSLHNFLKGWAGESFAAVSQFLFLNRKVYRSLHNVTIPATGGTTQIDHVIVSPYGVFVVESKNIDGWIFGGEKDAQWTVSNFGKKYKMQNPLRQNYRHIKSLADFLDLDESKFHSVVMFWGECEFKTPMPPGVFDRGYLHHIRSFQTVLFRDDEVEAIVVALQTGRLPAWSFRTHREHVASLKSRHESMTVCPTCGRGMVIRTAKSGARAGSRFFGCSGFPACRYRSSREVPLETFPETAEETAEKVPERAAA